MMPFRTDVGQLAADLPDPLVRVDDDGVVTWRNGRFRSLTEGTGPVRLGRPLRELVDTADRHLVDAALAGLSGGAERVDASVRMRRADGAWIDAVLCAARTPPFEERAAFVTVLVRPSTAS